MARVLSILTSTRKHGFTAQAYRAALAGMRKENVEIYEVWLPHYELRPCNSCFACIRDEEHLCIMNDDMGQRGEGALYKKVQSAHAIFLADPVYCWSNTSRSQLFFERLYTNLWTGALHGIPFGSISCASNQGMMHQASRHLCMLSYTYKMEWIDGLDIHVADFENKLKSCEYLGQQMAKAAIRVQRDGPNKLNTQEHTYSYMGHKWNPIYDYIYNLTQGTFDWSKSLPYLALSEKRFRVPEAIELLEETCDKLKEMIAAWNAQDLTACTVIFNGLSAAWTGATWKEFLEDNVVGAGKPRAYKTAD